jgi:hypothetical protein
MKGKDRRQYFRNPVLQFRRCIERVRLVRQ